MKPKTLSDKIDKETNLIMSYDVREFIKKCVNLSRKIKGVEGDWINIDVLKEGAGPKLAGNHSPRKVPVDTPEDKSDSNLVEMFSSGNHDKCANHTGQNPLAHEPSKTIKKFKQKGGVE